MTTDIIEYYNGISLVAAVKSSMVPLVGSKISIRRETWTVESVTYAVDYADDPQRTRMRANVDLCKD